MADRVIFVCILALAGIYAYATHKLPSLAIGDPLGPKAFPWLLTIALVICAVMLLLEMMKARKAQQSAALPSKAETTTRGEYLVVGGVVAWTFLYLLVFEFLGFVIATTIYLLALTAYFNPGKRITNSVTCVSFCVGGYFMFKVLGVRLAQGILPF